MLIDLQLHSTCSDGYLTPTKLAEYCKKRGIKVASLTDHNTVSSQEEFKRACKSFKIKVIPGMELYVKLASRHYNMLWYNFDINNPELHSLLRASQKRRRTVVRKALEKLIKKGYIINIDVLLDNHNHYIPINHVVDSFFRLNKKRIQKELHRKNITSTEIIHKYFRNKDKVRLHECYIDVKRIFKIRKQIGGQLVLAHACKFKWITALELIKFKKLGLDGVEVLTPHHSWNAISYLQALADQHGFIMTGGSDFHLFEKDEFYKIKNSWDYFLIDSRLLKGISKIIA